MQKDRSEIRIDDTVKCHFCFCSFSCKQPFTDCMTNTFREEHSIFSHFFAFRFRNVTQLESEERDLN